MELKEIGLFIDGKITEQHRNRATYCRNHKQVKQRVNEMINGLIFNEKDYKFKKIDEILNDLGYELTIKKIDK